MITRIHGCLKCAITMAAILGTIIEADDSTTEFKGGLRITCTDAACTFNEGCLNLDSVPGVPSADNSTVEYSGISGEIFLEPDSCEAGCTGCWAVPGSDTSTASCIDSAGYVYCPETDSCIRPWENSCPFEGDSFVGPVNITCSSGSRCSDKSGGCEITVGSYVIAGLYLDGLDGNYSLPEGCTATCQGCSCEDCPSEGNNIGEPSGTDDSGTTRPIIPLYQYSFLIPTLVLFSKVLTEMI